MLNSDVGNSGLSDCRLVIFHGYAAVLSSRGKLLALMNSIFFVSVFVVASAVELLFPPPLSSGWEPRFPEIFFSNNFVVLFLVIFLSNLVLSSFVFVSLPGFAFFPLSSAVLFYRAFLWGLLLSFQPTWLFLIAVPVIVLEGEAYCLAATAGAIVGISWLRPKWLYREEILTRGNAFRRAMKECLKMYVFVAVFLLIAALIEASILTFLST